MADTTPKDAIEICQDEARQNLGDNEAATSIGEGMFYGLVKGMGLERSAFLSIHGSEQRLRHLIREAFRAAGVKIEPDKGSAPTDM